MKRRLVIFAAAAVAALGATAAAFYLSRPERPPFVASYFFDEDRFATIRPGMGENEVRDRVGPALWQSSVSGRDVRIWTYSVMPSPVREWTEFEVRFDGQGRVTSARGQPVSQSLDPATGKYPLIGSRPPRPPEPLAAFPLKMVQGEAPRFAAGEGRYLVQVMASWCGPCTVMRPKVEALLAKMGPTPVKLVLVSIDEDQSAMRRYLKEHGVRHPVAWDPQRSLPGFARDKGIPRYALLQDGLICWFDFEHSTGSDQLADLEWFLRYAATGNLARHVEK